MTKSSEFNPIEHLTWASDMFKEADTPEEIRIAVHQWLLGAIAQMGLFDLPTSPGHELARTLEAIGRGHRTPMLQLPVENRSGGREHPLAEIQGIAIAAIEALKKSGWKVDRAISFVALSLQECLHLDASQLKNIRKKASRQKAKSEPTRYAALIKSWESASKEIESMASTSEARISEGVSTYEIELENAAIMFLARWESSLFD